MARNSTIGCNRCYYDSIKDPIEKSRHDLSKIKGELFFNDSFSFKTTSYNQRQVLTDIIFDQNKINT